MRVRKFEDLTGKDLAHAVKRYAQDNVMTGPALLHGVLIPGAGIIDTGALLGAFHVNKMGAGDYRVLNTVHYAGYVERGTFKMQARPYLKPALWKANRETGNVARASWKKIFG